MIVRMKPAANFLMVEHAVRTLEKKGFDVHVANGNGQVLIAALGGGSAEIGLAAAEMPGVENVSAHNGLFLEKPDSFLEAWQYIESKEGR